MSDAVRAVIDSAVRAGLPACYELPDKAAATAWRHRFYRMRNKSQDALLHNIQIVRESDTRLRIEYISMGVLTVAGQEIPVVPEAIADTAPEFDAADLAAQLGISLEEQP